MPKQAPRGTDKKPEIVTRRDGDSARLFWRHLENSGESGLIELLRTKDLVLISRVEAILAEIGVAVFVADRYMSALEGSLSFLPRRVLVVADAAARARTALNEAGLAAELRDG